MSSETLQYYDLERRRRESREFIEAHHRMPDGKLIATVQVCNNCHRQFVYRRRRKNCPCCQHQLRMKTMIIRTP